jgi:hypothetical protein
MRDPGGGSSALVTCLYVLWIGTDCTRGNAVGVIRVVVLKVMAGGYDCAVGRAASICSRLAGGLHWRVMRCIIGQPV